jgi:hypothetical protein
MKVKHYLLLESCVERGIIGGLLNEDLTANEDWLVERFTQRVMLEISEYFDFDDNETL